VLVCLQTLCFWFTLDGQSYWPTGLTAAARWAGPVLSFDIAHGTTGTALVECGELGDYLQVQPPRPSSDTH
jgi:hypothetical protein